MLDFRNDDQRSTDVAIEPESRGSILFLISNFGLGGAESQLFHLAMGLRGRGWNVAVASLSPLVHDAFVRAFGEEGISLYILQKSMNPGLGAMGRALREAWKLVRAGSYDAVVGFMPHGALMARLLGRFARVPRIVSSLRSVKSTRRWHDILLAATRHLDHFSVTNSTAAAKAQVQSGVIKIRTNKVIYNGLDSRKLPRLGGQIKAAASAAGKFRWLHVAVFRREKGHADLLHALRIIVAAKRPVELVLVGEGPLLSDSKELASSLGLGELVEFVGKQSEIGDLIAAADAFVLPSLWEGLPNALIEAMAGGLPAVATDVGGTPEVLLDGRSGFLAPAGNPHGLADAMLKLMNLDYEERLRFGDAARRHALANFSMESMVDAWDAVISSRSPRRCKGGEGAGAGVGMGR